MQWSIDKELIDYIMEISKDYYPKEFLALLRADKHVIKELLFVPALKSGSVSASFDAFNLPHYFDVVGTVHSHPSGNGEPSNRDLRLFSRYPVNLIVFYPFSRECLKVYDNKGTQIDLTYVL